MLKTALDTLSWIVRDQRKLIAQRFDGGKPFEVQLFLPNYVGRNVAKKAPLRRRRVVFFWDPEHFAQVHKSSPDTIDVSSAYSFLKNYFGAESVFVTSGAGHTKAKQAVYRAIRDHMTIGTDDLIFFNYSILEKFKAGTYPALKPIQEVSAAFLVRTIFGEQGTKQTSHAIEHAIAAAGNASATFLIMPDLVRFTRRFGVGLAIRRQRLHLRQFIRDQVDGISIGHNWADETPQEAFSEIVDNLMTLLIAGFETTATTIAWLLYRLASNHDLQAELRAEINERLHPDPVAYFADDKSLLAMCVQEALRMHPSIPFIIREVKKPFELGGVSLEPENYIVLSIEELHRRAFDSGEKFDPHRHAAKAGLPRLATFGGGAKICPGRAIAVQETRIITALIISKYLVSTTRETKAEVVRNQVSATPKGGMVLNFQRIH